MLGRPSAPPHPRHCAFPSPTCLQLVHGWGSGWGKWEAGSPHCSLAPARPRLSLSPLVHVCGRGVGGADLSSRPPASESSHLPWPLPSPSPPRRWPAASLPSCAARGLLMHARFFAWSLGRRETRHLHGPDCPPRPPRMRPLRRRSPFCPHPGPGDKPTSVSFVNSLAFS